MKKGTHLTDEQKKRVSESLKGRVFSSETKKKMSEWQKGKNNNMYGRTGNKNHFYGKKHTKESLFKISQSRKGKALGVKNGSKRIEVRRKISLSKMGHNSPFWKGGVSKLYNVIRHTFEYRQWRSDVFTRDNFTCQECGNPSKGDIQAHHIKQFAVLLKENNIKTVEEAIKCQSLWNINNGQTLCEKCHSETDTYLKRTNL